MGLRLELSPGPRKMLWRLEWLISRAQTPSHDPEYERAKHDACNQCHRPSANTATVSRFDAITHASGKSETSAAHRRPGEAFIAQSTRCATAPRLLDLPD